MNDPFSKQTQNEGMYNSQQSLKKMELLDSIKALQDKQEIHYKNITSQDAQNERIMYNHDAVIREIAELKKKLQDEHGEDYNQEYGSEGGRRKKRTHRRSKSRRSKSRAKKSRRSKH